MKVPDLDITRMAAARNNQLNLPHTNVNKKESLKDTSFSTTINFPKYDLRNHQVLRNYER